MTEPDVTRLVLYHASCRDGMCAAMVCWLQFKDSARYRPVTYNGETLRGIVNETLESHPKLDEVYVVDFTFRGEADTISWLLTEMGMGVTLIDHHSTAVDDITAISESVPAKGERINIRYAEDKSGAGLTWDFFYPNTPRPPVVAYVEDRDLWLWKLPDSDIVNTYLQSMPLAMVRWVKLFYEWNQETIRAIGSYQMTFIAGQVCEHMRRARYIHVEDGNGRSYRAAIFGCSLSTLTSETCDALLKHGDVPIDIAICVPINMAADGHVYSIRSRDTGKARQFAESYGGGGHDDAAGCKPASALIWHDMDLPS